jgi:hypothetical protein
LEPIAQIVPKLEPSEVRVTSAEGERTVLKAPDPHGDTLVGVRGGEETRVSAGDNYGVELRQWSWWRSLVVVVAIPGVLVAGFLVAMGGS